jgi:hypothetical protein
MDSLVGTNAGSTPFGIGGRVSRIVGAVILRAPYALYMFYGTNMGFQPQSPGGAMPNQRLKLSARGGRLKGKRSVLSAAAAGRSLSAIR